MRGGREVRGGRVRRERGEAYSEITGVGESQKHGAHLSRLVDDVLGSFLSLFVLLQHHPPNDIYAVIQLGGQQDDGVGSVGKTIVFR